MDQPNFLCCSPTIRHRSQVKPLHPRDAQVNILVPPSTHTDSTPNPQIKRATISFQKDFDHLSPKSSFEFVPEKGAYCSVMLWSQSMRIGALKTSARGSSYTWQRLYHSWTAQAQDPKNVMNPHIPGFIVDVECSMTYIWKAWKTSNATSNAKPYTCTACVFIKL